jgi:hypothetical protein
MLRRRAWIRCWRAGFRGAGVSATGTGRMSLVRAFHFVLPRIYNTSAAYRATKSLGIRRGVSVGKLPTDRAKCVQASNAKFKHARAAVTAVSVRRIIFPMEAS